MSKHSKKKKKVKTIPKKKKHKKKEKKSVKTKTEKHKKEPEHTKKAVKKTSSTIPMGWVFISGFLAVLLIISIFTQGFTSSFSVAKTSDKVVDEAINDLNNLKSTTSSDELKGAIDSSVSSLESLKQKIETETNAKQEPISFSGDQVELDFYVMSQCPYGTQVMDAIHPVLNKFGEAVDFEANYISTDLGEGNFRSLHGEPETKGNIVQLCAAKYNPKKYMDMIVCMDKNAQEIPDNWESCAEENGLDVEKIRTCYEGEEGTNLLSESVKKSQEAQATGSPTIYLNGERYQGGRDTTAFMRAICNELDNHPECESLPECASNADCTAEADKIGTCKNPGQDNAECVYTEPKTVTVMFITDDRCDECDPERINAITGNLFKGADFEEVKFDSGEGSELMEKYGIEFLPAYIFDANVEETVAWSTNAQLKASFISHDDGTYRLNPQAVGSTWDPFSEVCGNGKDDDDDGDIDCDDSDCENYKDCFETPTMDFFVMSYCPYGNQAEEAIAPVYDELEGEAVFRPHYIYYENYQGGGPDYCIDEESKYCSMHGVQEANQNIREQCVADQYGMREWFEFSLLMNDRCSAKNADSCWTDVAEELEYDVQAIETCQEEKAIEFAAEDARLMKVFSASGSPAVYINGESFSGGRTPAGYLEGLCSVFEDKPEGCSAELEGDTAAAPSAGACG
ncbi:thioredoxin domain-containing protein [Candidatus Woesearchaeota archaeon]|nr:thioredoxin domain-containing protein [Candidatus Woesearchaeota archaeon]